MKEKHLEELVLKLKEAREYLSKAISVLETPKKIKFFDIILGGLFVRAGVATLPARYRKTLIYVVKAQESLSIMQKLLKELSEEVYNIVAPTLQNIYDIDLNQTMLILSKEWPENEIIQQIDNKIQIIENTIKCVEKITTGNRKLSN